MTSTRYSSPPAALVTLIFIFGPLYFLLVEAYPKTVTNQNQNHNQNHNLNRRKGPYKVYRIYPNNTEELDYCVELWKSASSRRVNFWKEPSRIGAPVDVMVPSERQTNFQALLDEHNLGYIVTIQDVQKLIEERERPNSGAASKWQPEFRQLFRDDAHERAPFFDFRRFHSYEDMRIYMRSIERKYPQWAKVYSLGFSHEGRPIEMIKIGFPLSARGKKSIWIDAGIHAREWASSTTAIYFIHQLATKFGKDPQISQYVRELNWYISPVLNPDGYEYTRSSTDPEVRMWRKNRSPNRDVCQSESRSCCLGVDLNRNFDFHWGETGASDNPCEEIYQGSSPFSEPEARAVRDFILAHKNDVQAVITMHTYSQIWVHPFGHQRYSYPPDVDELRDTGAKAVSALEKLYGTKYKVGSGADTLYPAAGGSDDWSKSKAGIKFVYLLELRPEENVWDGFILDTDEILPTARETWEGVKVVVNNVMKRLNIEPVAAGSTDDQASLTAAGDPKHSPPFSTLRRHQNRERTESEDQPKVRPKQEQEKLEEQEEQESDDEAETLSLLSSNNVTFPQSPLNSLQLVDSAANFTGANTNISTTAAEDNSLNLSSSSSPNFTSNGTMLNNLFIWFDLAFKILSFNQSAFSENSSAVDDDSFFYSNSSSTSTNNQSEEEEDEIQSESSNTTSASNTSSHYYSTTPVFLIRHFNNNNNRTLVDNETTTTTNSDSSGNDFSSSEILQQSSEPPQSHPRRYNFVKPQNNSLRLHRKPS